MCTSQERKRQASTITEGIEQWLAQRRRLSPSVAQSARVVVEHEACLKNAAKLFTNFCRISADLHAEYDVTLSLLLPKLQELYALCKAHAADDLELLAPLKQALRNALRRRYGGNAHEPSPEALGVTATPAHRLWYERHVHGLKLFHRDCGGAHDAAFAATALDPRTWQHIEPGPMRDHILERAARFLAHLDRCFHGPGDVLDIGAHRDGAAAAVEPRVQDRYAELLAASVSPFDTTETAVAVGVAAAAAAVSAVSAGDASEGASGPHDGAYWLKVLKGVAEGFFAIARHHFIHTWGDPAWTKLKETNPLAAAPNIDQMPRDVVKALSEANPIEFWETSKDKPLFQRAYAMAMAVLAIPSTEAASERVFKQAKATMTEKRVRMRPETAEAQVIVGRALRALGINSPEAMAVTLNELGM